jgi:energy-coupling factor transport system substrate-specific component
MGESDMECETTMNIMIHLAVLSILYFMMFPVLFFQTTYVLPNMLTEIPVMVFLNLILLMYFMENQIRSYRYRSVLLLVIAAVSVLASFLRMIPLPMGITMAFLIPIVSGVVYGSGFGFIVGQLSMLVGGVFLGALGPWTPYQSFLMGVIGFYAGVFIIVLYVLIVGMAYGYWMSVSYWALAVQDLVVSEEWMQRLKMYTQFYISTSLIWDLTRSVGNILIFVILYSSCKELLERAKDRLIYYKHELDL